MPTLLHISDLHRTSGPRLHNDNLVAAIASDSVRWDAEGIPRPDVIVVSGDLIQGAGPASSDPEADIAAQYEEAHDLLRRLADELVGGDLSRVVLVPGNHDVSWSRSLAAMAPLADCPDGIAKLALESESGVRWDWSTQTAFEILGPDAYEARLGQYRDFATAFYAGVDPNPRARYDDLVFFNYPDLDLAVVGFSSWHGNDCFCEVGEIEPRLVAASRELLESSSASTAVAVWHHSIVGGPRARDYMDQRVVHQLVDFGFSLGLHGHQHYPGAAPYELRLPNLTSMVVVSAGSLAVGDGELPMGERRQYNVVVVDPASEEVEIHVRAMSPAGVFMGSHRDDFGGHTSVKLPLPHSPARPPAPTVTRRLDDAFTAVARGEHEEALRLVDGLGPSHDVPKRHIEIEALTALGRYEEVLELMNPPQTVEEVIRAVAMLLDHARFDDAQARLDDGRHLLEGSVAAELDATINARRMASS